MIEKRLIKALHSNDRQLVEEAFEEIYNKYYKLLVFIVSKVIKDQDDTIDIVNDVFLSFFNNLDNIEIDRNLKYYLVVSAKNKALTESMRRSRNKVEISSELVDSVPTYKKSHWQDYIDEFRKHLNEEEIALIIDHIVFEYSFKILAEMRNTTIFSVAGKYKRAMDKLKKIYERGDFDA